MRKILMTIAIVITSLMINAQDKYEFLIIEYVPSEGEICSSIGGKEFKKEKADYTNQKKSGYNANPLLAKVDEYQNNDWELMNFNTIISGASFEIHLAYMRKKKADKK